MYVITNRVPVTEPYRDEFEKRFRHRASQVDQQSGFLRMEVLRPLDQNGCYLVVTVWESEHAFRNWIGSEDFENAHQNPLPKEAYAGEATMERYELAILAKKGGL